MRVDYTVYSKTIRIGRSVQIEGRINVNTVAEVGLKLVEAIEKHKDTEAMDNWLSINLHVWRHNDAS